MIVELPDHVAELSCSLLHELGRLHVIPLQRKILPRNDSCLVQRVVQLFAIDVHTYSHAIYISVLEELNVLRDSLRSIVSQPHIGNDVRSSNEEAHAV